MCFRSLNREWDRDHEGERMPCVRAVQVTDAQHSSPRDSCVCLLQYKMQVK